MTESKAIKIFLASSITEFKYERLFLGNYIANIVCPIFKNDGVEVELIKCEDKPKGNKGDSSQKKIDTLLQGCGISIFLFKQVCQVLTDRVADVNPFVLKLRNGRSEEDFYGLGLCHSRMVIMSCRLCCTKLRNFAEKGNVSA